MEKPWSVHRVWKQEEMLIYQQPLSPMLSKPMRTSGRRFRAGREYWVPMNYVVDSVASSLASSIMESPSVYQNQWNLPSFWQLLPGEKSMGRGSITTTPQSRSLLTCGFEDEIVKGRQLRLACKCIYAEIATLYLSTLIWARNAFVASPETGRNGSLERSSQWSSALDARPKFHPLSSEL